LAVKSYDLGSVDFLEFEPQRTPRKRRKALKLGNLYAPAVKLACLNPMSTDIEASVWCSYP
jgi:hypothetical protein